MKMHLKTLEGGALVERFYVTSLLLFKRLHRDGDLPAKIINETDGTVKMAFYKDGVRDRDGDRPAIMIIEPDGQVSLERHYRKGVLTRDGGLPAAIERFPNGIHQVERYVVNGQMHREDGPAWIVRREDGYILEERFFLNGKEVVPPSGIEASRQDVKSFTMLKI